MGRPAPLAAVPRARSLIQRADGFRGGSEDEPVAESEADGSGEAERGVE